MGEAELQRANGVTAKLNGPERVGLMALLLLAGFLRLHDLDLISWTNDEGSHQSIAMHILAADFEDLPMAGFPSVGIRNSALFVYLLAAANVVVFHPLSGAVLIALLNVWALYMAFQLCRRYFSKPTAFMALAYCAVSPWSVLFARNMWPPSCLAPVCLLLIGLTFKWEATGKGLFSIGLLTLIVPQVHFSGACAVIWVACALFTAKRSVRWVPLLSGIVVGLATWTPWVMFQSITKWNDFRTAVNVAEGKHSLLDPIARIFYYLPAQLHSGGFSFWFDTNDVEMSDYLPGWLNIVLLAGGVALVGCWIAAMVHGLFVKRSRHNGLLILWILIPVVCLLLIRPDVHPHYLLVAFPMPLLLTADWIVRVPLKSRLKSIRIATGVACGITAIAFVLFLNGWRNFVTDGHLKGIPHYRRSYRMVEDTIAAITDDAAGQSAQLAGPGSGLFPAYNCVFDFKQAGIGSGADLLYWIEEPAATGEAGSRDDTEAKINDSMKTWRQSYAQWRIVRQWKNGAAVVYRLEAN